MLSALLPGSPSRWTHVDVIADDVSSEVVWSDGVSESWTPYMAGSNTSILVSAMAPSP